MEKKRVLVIALCLMLMTVVISSAASTLKVNEKIVRKSISMLVFLAITVITILPIYATSSN